jgi:hypothetical protein
VQKENLEFEGANLAQDHCPRVAGAVAHTTYSVGTQSRFDSSTRSQVWGCRPNQQRQLLAVSGFPVRPLQKADGTAFGCDSSRSQMEMCCAVDCFRTTSRQSHWAHLRSTTLTRASRSSGARAQSFVRAVSPCTMIRRSEFVVCCLPAVRCMLSASCTVYVVCQLYGVCCLPAVPCMLSAS